MHVNNVFQISLSFDFHIHIYSRLSGSGILGLWRTENRLKVLLTDAKGLVSSPHTKTLLGLVRLEVNVSLCSIRLLIQLVGIHTMQQR